jgi:hypothetical protein
MLRDVANPPVAPARVLEVKPCAECCRYEMKLQKMREAYELLTQAVAASDNERRRK